MVVLKMETMFPVQTKSFFVSFENAGGEETKLFPSLIISLSLTRKRKQVLVLIDNSY